MRGKVDWSALLGAFLKPLRISSSFVPLQAALAFHMPFGYLHSAQGSLFLPPFLAQFLRVSRFCPCTDLCRLHALPPCCLLQALLHLRRPCAAPRLL